MINRVLDAGLVYRLWQLPFAAQKFAPVARALAPQDPGRVLDLGCGPGTNAAHFRDAAYVGVDLNPRYVAAARRRFGDRFRVGDATEALPDDEAPYDLVLINSLLHHLDDRQVDAVLGGAAELLAPGGEVHILDLELPETPGAARFLAVHDRGDFPRPREDWSQLLARSLEIKSYEPFALRLATLRLWHMFHAVAAASD